MRDAVSAPGGVSRGGPQLRRWARITWCWLAFAAATTLWLGFEFAVPFLMYGAILGGVLTLAILGLRQLPLPAALGKISWIDRLHDSKSGVPYGIALAIAGMVVYTQTPIFIHFAH